MVEAEGLAHGGRDPLVAERADCHASFAAGIARRTISTTTRSESGVREPLALL
jgi:hypothetical protein